MKKTMEKDSTHVINAPPNTYAVFKNEPYSWIEPVWGFLIQVFGEDPNWQMFPLTGDMNEGFAENCERPILVGNLEKCQKLKQEFDEQQYEKIKQQMVKTK